MNAGRVRVAILLVIGFLTLDYISYRLWARWPVQPWQMYAKKAPAKRLITYRRFVAHYSDGSSRPTTLAEAADFLTSPYRVDGIMSIDLPVFMKKTLALLGPDVVGLSFEKRAWRYPAKSLEEHLVEDVPKRSFTVLTIDGPPRGLRAEATGNLLQTGGFDVWNPAGQAASWDIEAYWSGIAIDADGDQAALLAAPPGGSPALRQTVRSPGGTARVRALVWSDGEAAAVEARLAGAESPAARQVVPGDRAWHAVELTFPVPLDGAEVTIALLGSSGHTYFDDAVLVTVPES